MDAADLAFAGLARQAELIRDGDVSARELTAPDAFTVAAQLVGRPGDEPTLLSLSAQLESATGRLPRRPPLAA